MSFNANNFSSQSRRLDTVGSFTANQIALWMAIRTVSIEYSKSVKKYDSHEFACWLCKTWGIRIYIENGNIDPKVSIEDEAKFTMFLLKYTKNEN